MIRTVAGHLVALPIESMKQLGRSFITDPLLPPRRRYPRKKKSYQSQRYLNEAIYLRRQLRELRYQCRKEIERLENDNRLLKKRERQLKKFS